MFETLPNKFANSKAKLEFGNSCVYSKRGKPLENLLKVFAHEIPSICVTDVGRGLLTKQEDQSKSGSQYPQYQRGH